MTLDNDECNDDSWECSDIDNPYECHANENCEWQVNPMSPGQCIELNDIDILESFFKLDSTLCSNHEGNINNIFDLGGIINSSPLVISHTSTNSFFQ